MTKKVFYEKVGRRYVPVSEYNSEWVDAVPRGTHLVICHPGGRSTRYGINPEHAPLIAASRVAEDKICSAVYKASEYKPSRKNLTPRQKELWEELKRELGDEMFSLQGVSIADCVRAGINAMITEAEENMRNPSVKQAYEHFLMVSELSK